MFIYRFCTLLDMMSRSQRLNKQYGSERMAFILANTLQQGAWDGRFSRDNKTWASEFHISENIVHGMDMNRELVVSIPPGGLGRFY